MASGERKKQNKKDARKGKRKGKRKADLALPLIICKCGGEFRASCEQPPRFFATSSATALICDIFIQSSTIESTKPKGETLLLLRASHHSLARPLYRPRFFHPSPPHTRPRTRPRIRPDGHNDTGCWRQRDKAIESGRRICQTRGSHGNSG